MVVSLLPAAGEGTIRPAFYLEFTQTLAVNLGLEIDFTKHWGIKGSFGTGIPLLKSISWSLLGYYRVTDPGNLWQLEIEAGLPVAYASPSGNNPFHGYLPGICLSAGCLTRIGLFSLRAGGALWFEHQEITGWKGPGIMPVIALTYTFKRLIPPVNNSHL